MLLKELRISREMISYQSESFVLCIRSVSAERDPVQHLSVLHLVLGHDAIYASVVHCARFETRRAAFGPVHH